MNLVITGSSTGIGRALTERLLSAGHRVWGLARSKQEDLVARHQTTFHASICDVTDWKQVEQVAAHAAAAWPRVDGLITCAGWQGEIGRAVKANPARWSATVRANLDGTYHAIRAFHGLLSQPGPRAKAVCFSGGGAAKPRPNFSAYGVAKTGVVRLVETIAEEEKGTAFDINAVAPGGITTRMTEEIVSLGPSVVGEVEYQAAVKQKTQGGASLEKTLSLVEWLLSPDSDGISGRLISAQWDPWPALREHRDELAKTDIYALRRVLPAERGKQF